MSLGILCILLATSPPSPIAHAATDPIAPTDQRMVRVKYLQELGAQKTEKAIDELLDVAKRSGTVWERQLAVSVMADHHKARGLKVVETLMDDNALSVKIEATIRHFQWTHSPKTLKRLKRLRQWGPSLRRAFEVGREAARPKYSEDAEAYFNDCIRQPLVYTRLDGALGLVEINTPATRSQGLAVIDDLLESQSTEDRIATVKYITVSYDDAAFGPRLERAAKDPDLRVAQAAKNALASRR